MPVPLSLSVINLELPSGTKWASCNIGATIPEEIGDRFAWGEYKKKKVYDWKTYIHCDGDGDSCHDLGINICGTRNDVASMVWGDKWNMPSVDQMIELINYCSYEWIAINGIYGGMFTSIRNGNFLFFPATTSTYEDGYYWSCIQEPRCASEAYCLGIGDRGPYVDSFCFDRCAGRLIRAVMKKNV